MSKVPKHIVVEAQRLESWDNSEDVKELLTVIENGDILEVGCGTGRIIEELSKSLPDSLFIGIDIVDHFLDIATGKNIKNAIFVKSSATEKTFPDNTFDTVLFRDSLHEIRNTLDDKGVEESIKNAYGFLKGNGSIVIRDAFVTAPKDIRVTFESRESRRLFSIFAKSSKIVRIRKKKEFIEMDAGDLVSFLGKYKKIKRNSGIKELSGTGSYSIKEYDRLLRKAGFKMQETRLYKFPKTLVPTGVSFDFNKLPETYCMLVYKKELY